MRLYKKPSKAIRTLTALFAFGFLSAQLSAQSSTTATQAGSSRANFANQQSYVYDPATELSVEAASFTAEPSARRLAPRIDQSAFGGKPNVRQQSQFQIQAPMPQAEGVVYPQATPVMDSATFAQPTPSMDSQSMMAQQPQPTFEYSGEIQNDQGLEVVNQNRFYDPNFRTQSDFGSGAIALGTNNVFKKDGRPSSFFSPFGISPSEPCDEWGSFCRTRDLDLECNCGGLKANPGHLGLPWLRSKDSCDTTEPILGRRGCGCDKGCKTGCKPNCETSSCNECDGECESDCSSCKKPNSSGLFGKLKAHCSNK